MPDFRYTPTHLDGVDLTGAAFASVEFDIVNGPLQTQQINSVNALVTGLGDRHVSQQPTGATWLVKIIAASLSESDKDTISETFSSDRGLVYLRADDGAGTNWRVPCSVTKLEGVPRKPLLWLATLDIPDPVWQANTSTMTTGNFNQMSGDSASDNVTNGGNRKARPVITIDPQTSPKTGDITKRFQNIWHGYVINRAPLPWNNLPIAVTDTNEGHGTGLDAASLVNSGGADGTLAGLLVAGSMTIFLNGGHGFAAGTQYFWIPPEGGNGEEQIIGTLAGNEITVIERGIGGTTADGHSNGADINISSLLADGSDWHVYVDGVEVERWIGQIETATARAWVNMTMPPQLVGTLLYDITDGSGDAGVQLVEGVGEWPDRGVVMINRELHAYTGRDLATRKLTGVVDQFFWEAAIGSHSAGDSVYLVGHTIINALGRWGIDAAPEPLERRPAIDLEQSTNAAWYWGDAASDPQSIFYDPAWPGRTAQFTPDFEIAPADQNNAEPLLLDTSNTKLAWKDSVAAEGKLQVGRMTLRLPQGIQATANAITYDAQPRRFQRLRMLARDLTGQEVELLDLTDVDEGADAGAQLTPTDVLHELTLQGVRAGVLGEVTKLGAGEYQLNAAAEHVTQKFILDQDTAISGFLLRLKRFDADQTFTFVVYMLEWDASTPETGRVIWQSYAVSPDSGGDLTTALAWYRFYTGLPASLFVAGTYSLQIIILSHTNGVLHVSTAGAASQTKHNRTRSDTGGGDTDTAHVFTKGVLEFAVLHEGGGPIQPEVVAANEDDESNFDKLILLLNDDASDDMVPFVDRSNVASGDAAPYQIDGKIINNTTGDEIAINIFLDGDQTLEIDCERRRVVRIEDGLEWEVGSAIKPTAVVDWLPLAPGVNNLTYEDSGMADTDLTIVHRDTRV